MTGVVAHVVECLLSKHQTLISICSTAKIKRMTIIIIIFKKLLFP
jgi:hypothetical protein